MKTQQHLTPRQVEELRALGVEFEDTIDVWIQVTKDRWERRSMDSQRKSIEEYTEHQGGCPRWVISCPSLQDLLEKLPKTQKSTIADLDMPLALFYCKVTKRWYAGYEYMGIDHGSVSAGDTPLEAAFNLAKEVATHHPESLTKKD